MPGTSCGAPLIAPVCAIVTRKRDDTSPVKGRDEPRGLDYAHGVSSLKPPAPPIFGVVAGVIAFAAMVVQIPWASIAFPLFWAGNLDPWPLLTDERIEGVTCGLIICAPTLVALGLGFYSVRIGGISLRNILGVLGLILAVAAAIWVVVASLVSGAPEVPFLWPLPSFLTW